MSRNGIGTDAIKRLSDWVQSYASGGEINKQAAPDGSSSHASVSVDDGTKPATEGSRSSENTADVKKQQPAQTPEEATSRDANQHPSGGRTRHGNEPDAAYCDENLEEGTAGTKKKKDIPDSHTAGPKDQEKSSAASLLSEAHSLLKKLAEDSSSSEEAPAEEAPVEESPAEEKEADAGESADSEEKEDDSSAAEKEAALESAEKEAALESAEKEAALESARTAGATAAQAVAEKLGLVPTEKQASSEEIAAPEDIVSSIAKEAQMHAVRVHQYLSGFAKQAMSEAELMAAADQGGGIPGAPAGVEAAAGGMPADMGAGQVSEEDLMMLAQLLEELGITPEELLSALAEEGAAGGMPPEAMPAEAMPAEAMPVEAMPAGPEPKMAARKEKLRSMIIDRVTKAAAAVESGKK